MIPTKPQPLRIDAWPVTITLSHGRRASIPVRSQYRFLSSYLLVFVCSPFVNFSTPGAARRFWAASFLNVLIIQS